MIACRFLWMRLCDERKLLGWISEVLYTPGELLERQLKSEAKPVVVIPEVTNVKRFAFP